MRRALLLGLTILLLTGCVESEQLAARNRAISLCHESARARLKAPGSAKFARDSEVNVGIFQKGARFRGRWIPEGTRTIESYVDSQNSFGALLRSKVNCLVDPSNNLLEVEVTS